MENIIGISLLAVVIEGTITYLFGKNEEYNQSRNWLMYVSLLFGIVVAIAYKVDIVAMTGLQSPFPYVGEVVSGLILGRGSNYLNDILQNFKK